MLMSGIAKIFWKKNFRKSYFLKLIPFKVEPTWKSVIRKKNLLLEK